MLFNFVLIMTFGPFYTFGWSKANFLKMLSTSSTSDIFLPSPFLYNFDENSNLNSLFDKLDLHIDENNRNNHYTNLKWGTHWENMSTAKDSCSIPKSYKKVFILGFFFSHKIP